MNYRLLGRTGVLISTLAIGGDNILNPTPEAESIRVIEAALDNGINLIDTSNSYMNGESERIIGKALRQSGRRHQALVATKVHYPTGNGPNDKGNSRLHIMRACEESLTRLGVEAIDLYQTHRPALDIPLDETLGALTDLVRQGKVRYIGSSTAPAWHLVESVMVSELRGLARYVCEQSPYNLLDRRIENELIPVCERYDFGLLCWSPMAMGLLAGRYSGREHPDSEVETRASRRGGIYAERITARGIEMGRRFVELARDFQLDPAQLAILWVKEQGGVTAPIIGPRTVEQLRHLLPVAEMKISEELRNRCDELVPPGSAVANFFNSAPWMKQSVDS